MSAVTVALTVNGEDHALAIAPWTTVADLLRERLGLAGTRIGCGEGVCGSCTVLLDGEPVRSCLMLAMQADGRSIVTVEGHAVDPLAEALQQAFVDHYAAQCGFCTSGMLSVARHYLGDETIADHDDEASIRGALDAVICRCTGYQSIVAAVRAVAKQKAAHGHG